MTKKVLAPGVVQYPFPEKLASSLIGMLESDDSLPWNRSLVGTNGHSSEVRTSEQIALEAEMPIAASKIKEVFIECVKEYMQDYEISITQDESLVLLRYSEYNKYDYHVDANWNLYRVLSGLIYLNPTEYEGGETHFDQFDLSINPEEPSIVLFPSNYIYKHAAMPVTSGVKYIIVTWMNDLPPGISPTIIDAIAHATGRH